MLLTIKQISQWMKDNNLPGSSIKNIYKRLNSGNNWGFVFERGRYVVSEEDLENIWLKNPIYLKRGRKKKIL